MFGAAEKIVWVPKSSRVDRGSARTRREASNSGEGTSPDAGLVGYSWKKSSSKKKFMPAGEKKGSGRSRKGGSLRPGRNIGPAGRLGATFPLFGGGGRLAQ